MRLTPEILANRFGFADLAESGDRPALSLRIGRESEHREVSFRELGAMAAAAAAELEARPGERVALLMPHTDRLVALFFGVILRGAVPSIIAWPTAKMDPAKYRRNVHAVVSRLGAQWIVTEHTMAAELGASIGEATVVDAAALELTATGAPALAQPIDVERPLFIQFSGGTTGTQKSVPISLKKLHEQLVAYDARIALAAADRVISWLPLYHDMGLVACLLMPFAYRLPLTMFAPMEWVMDPGRFLAAVGRDRATLAWLPNFAYAFMAKKARLPQEGVDLAPLRALVNCSEPVRAESMAAFAERFAEHGFDRRALHACYAMAEATFAVTQTTADDPPRELAVSREGLGRGRLEPRAGERVLVSCGRPIPSVEVRVDAAEGAIGEIALRGPFIMDDYLIGPGETPRWAFDGEWYKTGDLGAVVDGHLYVTGRKKDVIIVGGINVFPEDLELAAGEVPGIHAGRVVAMGIDDPELGTERLVIVAEVDDDADLARADELEEAVRRSALTVAGVAPNHAFIVPPRWIVKSTAGKISRSETRARVLERWDALTKREGT